MEEDNPLDEEHRLQLLYAVRRMRNEEHLKSLKRIEQLRKLRDKKTMVVEFLGFEFELKWDWKYAIELKKLEREYDRNCRWFKKNFYEIDKLSRFLKQKKKGLPPVYVKKKGRRWEMDRESQELLKTLIENYEDEYGGRKLSEMGVTIETLISRELLRALSQRNKLKTQDAEEYYQKLLKLKRVYRSS